MKVKALFLLSIMIIVLFITTQCNPVTTTPEVTVTANIPGSALDGKTLVETKCVSCHGMDRIEKAGKDANEWKSTVERMVNKGADLTADEQIAVIEYLAKTYP